MWRCCLYRSKADLQLLPISALPDVNDNIVLPDLVKYWHHVVMSYLVMLSVIVIVIVIVILTGPTGYTTSLRGAQSCVYRDAHCTDMYCQRATVLKCIATRYLQMLSFLWEIG